MSAGKAQIYTPRRVFHTVKISPDALAPLPIFSGDLFFGRQYTCRSVEINIDIPSFHFLHYTGNDFSFFGAVFVNNRSEFRFTDFLDNDLLGGLRGNAPIIIL